MTMAHPRALDQRAIVKEVKGVMEEKQHPKGHPIRSINVVISLLRMPALSQTFLKAY